MNGLTYPFTTLVLTFYTTHKVYLPLTKDRNGHIDTLNKNHIPTPSRVDTSSTTTPFQRTRTSDFPISDPRLLQEHHTTHSFYTFTTGHTQANTALTFPSTTWENESYVWHRNLLITLQHYKKLHHHTLHADVTHSAFQSISALTADSTSTPVT